MRRYRCKTALARRNDQHEKFAGNIFVGVQEFRRLGKFHLPNIGDGFTGDLGQMVKLVCCQRSSNCILPAFNVGALLQHWRGIPGRFALKVAPVLAIELLLHLRK